MISAMMVKGNLKFKARVGFVGGDVSKKKKEYSIYLIMVTSHYVTDSCVRFLVTF